MTRANSTAKAWRLLRSDAGNAAYNMAVDEALLTEVATLGSPVLRFFSWNEPAATFGYFQKFADVERMTLLRPLIRRATGGGLVPHDADWTYSLAAPPGDSWYESKATESYERIHEWIKTAFSRLGITTELAACCRKELPGQCFIGHEKSDVLCHGRKVAGAAQRRTREGLLIQGSVQPPGRLSRSAWEAAMCDVASAEFGVQWADFEPTADFTARVTKLAENYSQPSHNRRR